MPEPQELIGIAKEVFEYIVHAFGAGTLTTTGVQYGTSGAATSTDVWKVVETQTIQPFTEYFGSNARIIEVEFELTTSAMHVSDTMTGATVTYAYQVKNVISTSTEDWVWLMPTSSGHSTAVGSTAAETTYSGRMVVSSTFDRFPFQVRLLVMSGGLGAATATSMSSSTGAYARAKGSSYIRVYARVE